MLTIKILGPGCSNCEKTAAMVREIVKAKNLDAEVVLIKEFKEIAKMGVLSTPGLVIGDQVKLTGRVPTRKEIEEWLS